MSEAKVYSAKNWSPDPGVLNAKMYGGFLGASREEWTSNWRTRTESPDETLSGDIRILRERSLDLHRNSALISGATETLVRGVVGRGIRPKSRATTGLGEEADNATRKALDALWSEWAYGASVDGVTSFYDLQAQAVTNAFASGDTLILWPEAGQSDSPITARVDLVDAARIETPSDMTSDGNVRYGVNYINRAVDGYYVAKSERDTGAARSDYYYFQRSRMGRINSALFMRPGMRRAGQSRQTPGLTPAIRAIKDLENYITAELRRANTNSRIAGAITAPDPEQIAKAFANINTPSAMSDGAAAYQGNYMGRGFGTLFDAQIMSLATGETLQFFSPNNTNSGMKDFVDTCLRIAAGSYNLPHSVAFSLFADVNYSNARTQILQARRTYDIWREALNKSLNLPTWALFVKQAWAKGLLPFVKSVSPEVLAAEWRADIERWLDPVKEIQAYGEAIRLGFASHHSVLSELGEDAEEILKQEMEYKVRRKTAMAEYGLTDADMGDPSEAAAQPAEPEEPENDGEEVPKKEEATDD